MLENLAYLHYGYMYEQGEKVSEISLEPPKNGLALLLALCTWITSSESATAAPVLEYGNSGEAVVSLQNQLKQANCLPQDASSDGRYGEITRAAITRLQQQHKLLVDGIAGKQTYAALDANQTCTASTSNTGLKLGDRGKEVELLQIQLANWGFPLDQKKRLEPTGKFDLATQEALQEFEKSFELEPDDGRLDPQTSKILWQPRIEALIEASRYEYWSDYTLRWITSALKKDATKAVPKLLTLLRDRQNDISVRTSAAEVLGYMGVEANKVIPVLINVASDKTEDKNLRREAVEVIGGFGADARDAVEPLLKILKGTTLKDTTEDQILRQQVVDSLSAIGPAAQAAIPTLITLLDDKNYPALGLKNRFQGQTLNSELDSIVKSRMYSPLRESVALALAGVGSAAVPELIAALQDPDEKVRYSAAFALGKIQPPVTNAVEPLTAIMNNPKENPNIRWMAASTLEAMGQDTKGFFSQNPRKSPNTLARQGCPLGEVFNEYLGQCVQEPYYPTAGGRLTSQCLMKGKC